MFYNIYIGVVYLCGILNIWVKGGVGGRYFEYGEFDSE